MKSPSRCSGRRFPLIGSLVLAGFSAMGNSIVMVALPWMVLDLTGNALSAGLAVAAGLIPMICGLLVGGTLIDHFGPRLIAAWGNFLSAAGTAAIPMLFYIGHLEINVLIFLVAVGAVMDGPASIAPVSRHPELARMAGVRLESVQSINEALGAISLLVGLPVTGALIALIGAPATLWASAALSFVAMILSIACLPGRSRKGASEASIASLVEASRFLIRDPLLRSLILLGPLFGAVFGALEIIIMPAFFKSEGHSAAILGLFLSAAGAGAIAGAAIYGIWGHLVSGRLVMLAGCAVQALGILILSYAPPVWFICVVGVFLGLAAGPIAPAIASATLRRVPVKLRGRVLSLSNAADFSAIPFGLIVAGAAINMIGEPAVLFGTAITAGVVTLLAALLPGLKYLDNEKDRAAVRG